MELRVLPEGVRSQFLGPLCEWILSHNDDEFDATNDPFWYIVCELIKSEPGDEPDWMTEVASDLLGLNDPA